MPSPGTATREGDRSSWEVHFRAGQPIDSADHALPQAAYPSR
ncbi:MAG: hypothetical protein ACFB12_24180 [Leptolyngbyaceae cyanobacterium]